MLPGSVVDVMGDDDVQTDLNMFTILFPKNTCVLSRPRSGSTPFPHSSPTIYRRKDGRR